MGCTKYQILLVILMVTTGSMNTLFMKWADNTECAGKNGDVHHFDHPFFQSSCMFTGEIICMILFKMLYKIYSMNNAGSEDVNQLTRGNRNFNPFILFPPAMCDMAASSIMYIGLTLTYASSFQMFRGSVIVFVGLLSMIFLKRMLKLSQWFGILGVISGLVLVGVSDFIAEDDGEVQHAGTEILIGDMMIFLAQIITAIQMVIEEKFVGQLDIPALQAIGWEGLFGFAVLAVLHVPLAFIKPGEPFTNTPNGTMEDVVDAFVQMGNCWELSFAVMGTIFSISFFNFAGISVTKELSATTRMVVDSARTLIIWIVSLTFMGQKFHWLQLLGFIILLCGMSLYNGVTCKPPCKCCRRKTTDESENATTANPAPTD